MRRWPSSIAMFAGAGLIGAGLVLGATEAQAMTATFQLTSSAYREGAKIPARFTCVGQDVSPPLAWSGAPSGTKSFALVIEDPDAPDPRAPTTTWIHWVLYDIPPQVHQLSEGASKNLPAGVRSGENSWKHATYGGPCPPIGRHRYVHILYALDVMLPDLHAPGKQALERAMRGHVLAHTQLVATYEKPR